MALILGLYAKRAKLRDEDCAAALREFTAPGAREPLVWRDDRVLFAVVRQGGERAFDPIVTSAPPDRALVFGGDLYETEGATRLLQANGRPAPGANAAAALLLAGFEALGERVLEGVTGTFAAGLYDRRGDVLTLANDAFGLHPLFVYDATDLCAFSSEYEPLTALPGFDARLDEDAIAEYFVLKAPLGERTFFARISNLRPGSLLTVTPERTRWRQHDGLEIAIDHNRSLAEFAADGAALLRSAVSRRLHGRVTARSALTGGMDSRLTLAAMTPQQREIVEFHTQQRHSLEPELDEEAAVACMLARRFGLRHKLRLVYDGETEPLEVDASFMAGLRRSSSSKYRLEGFYGGEFLGGGAFTKFPQLDADSEWSENRLRTVLSAELRGRVRDPIDAVREERGRIRAESAALLFDMHFYTRGFLTTFGGGSSYGWVCPYRQMTFNQDSLFRDPALLRFLLTVPPDMLRERRLIRRIYTDHFREFCEIPTTRVNDVAPRFVPARAPEPPRKRSFARLLRAYVEDPHTWSRGLYDRESVESALREPGHWLVPAFADFESWCRARADHGP